MKIGLIIATDDEYNTLVNGFDSQIKELNNDLFNAKCMFINGHELFVVKSGIGEIAAASLTQYLITKFSVNLIINYGVCGALKANLKLSDVVIVKNVVHYDFDISQIDKIPVATYPGYDSFLLPTTLSYIDLVKKFEPNLNTVICASGDKFISNESIKKELVEKYDADICDMESAGIVLTCLKNKVDVFSLKGVSDTGSDEEYSAFAKRTCEILFKTLKHILYSI